MSTQKNMIPMPISSFLNGSRAEADIYIKINERKYIKVLKKGDDLNLDRIRTYEDQKVEHLYISPDEFGPHVENYIKLSSVLLANKKASSTQKLTIFSKAIENVMTEIQHMGVEPACLNHAMEVSKNIIQVVNNNTQIANMIGQLEQIGEDYVKHVTCVSLLSCTIAYHMGWKGEKVQNLLSMGGMFHDVGFKELPPELWNKPRSDMNREEFQLYESHPERGKQILLSISGMPPELVSIASDHHEKPGGKGFPNKLIRDKIFPLARIIGLADELSHQMLKSTRNPNPKNLREARLFLEQVNRSDFDQMHWEALEKMDADTSTQKKAS